MGEFLGTSHAYTNKIRCFTARLPTIWLRAVQCAHYSEVNEDAAMTSVRVTAISTGVDELLGGMFKAIVALSHDATHVEMPNWTGTARASVSLRSVG